MDYWELALKISLQLALFLLHTAMRILFIVFSFAYSSLNQLTCEVVNSSRSHLSHKWQVHKYLPACPNYLGTAGLLAYACHVMCT